MDEKFFTLDEVSKYLNIPKSTIYKLSQTVKMPSVKIGKQLRFRKSSIDSWITVKEGRKPETKNKEAKYILLIDDDQSVLKTIANFLRINGYNVEPVESGEEALKQAEKRNFNLIISDIKMSGMNGIETIKRIRELNRAQSRPAAREIFITGYADGDVEQEAERLGVADFIYKPFVTDEFIKIIENNLI